MMVPSSSSKHVFISHVEDSKAIAIVLGHLGADSAELQRLSKLYTDRHCSVVAARSPPLDFFLAQHGRLRPVSHGILKETDSLVRQLQHQHQHQHIHTHTHTHSHTPQQGDTENTFNTDGESRTDIPIVIHMWSNGGSFLWEQLQKDPGMATIIQPRLHYVAFDSCPCYLHMPWAVSPYWNDAFPFPGWTSWGRKIYLLGASMGLSLWCLVTGSLKRSHDFWTSMRHPPPCQHLLYMYSTDDKVTDATRIDALINEQRMAHGKHVTVLRYEDSAHCRLDRDHPQDYAGAVDEALATAIQRASKGSDIPPTIR